MTLKCLDKFCVHNICSLEGEERMCMLPERRGQSSVAQPSPQPFTWLCPCRDPKVLWHSLWTKDKYSIARRQGWCPAHHLCSLFHECTCVSKYSVVICLLPSSDCCCNMPANHWNRKTTCLRAKSCWSLILMFFMMFVKLIMLHKFT